MEPNPYLKGTVGSCFIRNDCDEQNCTKITMKEVQAGLIDSVLVYFLKFLAEDIPRRTKSKRINDLYWALCYPESSKLTFVGQWVLGCAYRMLIQPRFENLESFISTIGKFSKSVKGMVT